MLFLMVTSCVKALTELTWQSYKAFCIRSAI